MWDLTQKVPIPKAVNKIPQDNQLESIISNQVGDIKDKLYRYVL